MAELMLPNIVGQYNQGFDRGQSMRASKLAGLALTSQGPDRQSALSQLAGVSPQAAMGLQDRFAAQDQRQAQAQQAAEVDHAQKLNGAARFVLSAYQSGDPARLQGAWNAVRPYLAQISGKQPPPQFDPAMLPKMYEIVGQSGGMPDQKGTVVAPGGVLVNSATGEQMFANPAKAPNLQPVDVPDGRGGNIKMLFDPASGRFIQPNYGGQPQQSGPNLDAINAQASDLVNSGQMTPQQADAWIKQQYAAAGMQIDGAGAGGGLGYDPGKRAVTLSADELRAAGLPEGTVAQRDATGKISVVSKPPQLSPDKLADIAAKRQKAQAAQQETISNIDDSIGQIDTLLNSPGFANIGTFTGDTFGRIPHTDTADARAQLDTVGNQSLLTTLGNMKSLSATGASGFGALSDSEGKILRNAAANLTEKQSNAALRQHLLDYKAKLQRTRQRLASMQVKLPEDSVGQPQQSQPQSGGWSIEPVQ